MNSNLIVHSSTIHDSVRYIKNRGPRPWLRRASSSTWYGRRSVATSSNTNNLSSASPVEHSLSWSLPIRRLWHSHVKVLSATQRLGSTSKPRRGNIFSASMCRPSSCHSLAQASRTFSGGGFGERCTTPALRPKDLSAHSSPRPRGPPPLPAPPLPPPR